MYSVIPQFSKQQVILTEGKLYTVFSLLKKTTKIQKPHLNQPKQTSKQSPQNKTKKTPQNQ